MPVDFELRGCPIDKRQLVEVLSAFLAGRKPVTPAHSVCIECKLKGNVCVMVAHGTPCLGPVTHAGCGALCPSYDRGCYGCFGPMETPNAGALSRELARLGMSRGADRIASTAPSTPPPNPSARKPIAMARKTIKVDYLARVEGEGALTVVIRDGAVTEAQLRIFEPPRFFEAFLRGRAYSEAPDITARICGICPVAYQMSAVHAMEDALGITVGGQLRALRRLLYCGEWIESHTLHVYMLHAPDFLGYHGAVEMARDHADIVRRGLALKKIGNALMTLVGGREVHPINVRVGGFYKVPRKRDLAAIAEQLKRARDLALETVRWTAGFDFPDRSRDYELVSLSHPDEYPINEGRIVSNRGLDITADAYDAHFEEIHVAHSNALQARHPGPRPLPRRTPRPLRAELRQAARRSAARRRTRPASRRSAPIPTRASSSARSRCSMPARRRSASSRPTRSRTGLSSPPSRGPASATPRPRRRAACSIIATGSATDGRIEDAVIIPPTSQNQASVEDDLKVLINGWIDLPDDELRHRCEQTVRNYDPCISCATHFLDLRIDRG